MKKGFLLLGVIFLFGGLVGRAQIYEMYSQDFETGTPVTYSVIGNGAVQTTYQSGGSRAMKLTNNSTSTVILLLDTVDFTANAQFNYYTLEFMHICYCEPTMQLVNMGGVIEVKRPGSSTWLPLTQQHYNMTDGGSAEFNRVAAFNKYSYEPDWSEPTSVNNMMWKNERFDLDMIFYGVPPQERKLEVRFVMSKRTSGSSAVEGWYIDDVRMRASSQVIVSPVVKMLAMPDCLNYPSSRGAKVIANVTTAALLGIDPDSVFVEYTVGSNPVPQRAYMSRVGATSRYEGRIPFYGYDTLMSYHVVARDMTNNRNTAYYPKNQTGRVVYRCVRGKENTAHPFITSPMESGVLPFPTYGDNRSEFIYDSVVMDSMGFRAGAITAIRFKQQSTFTRSMTRQRLQVKMANVDNSIVRFNTGNGGFLTNDMQIVYDSSFTIDQASIGSPLMVQLQDTFFYGGSDMVVQVMYHNSTDLPQATRVMTVGTPTNKASVYYDGYEATLGENPFNNLDNWNQPYTINRRPYLDIVARKNVPLIYDCGVSSMAYPSFTVPATVGLDSVAVWLRNFGVNAIDSVDIAYSLDNGSAVYYHWHGHLTGGDSVRVLLTAAQNYTLGYHTIRAWVVDSLTSGGVRWRDHEPLNNSTETPFVACNGPYSGVLTVGPNSSNDFVSLERCLFSLSRCGISGPTTVKLPAGTYGYTVFPYIPGTSATNYVLFEPATPGAQVVFRQPATTARPMELIDMTEARSIRFSNIYFANTRNGNINSSLGCQYLVRMGAGSSNCQFLNCTFVDSLGLQAYMPEALLSTGYADSVLVEGCTFYGGKVGIDVIGAAPDNRSTGNVVRSNELASQLNTAISVVNQDRVLIDSNMCNDVRTNASYVVLCQYVYDGSRITRNKVYSTKGASCIGVSDMHGTASQYCYVANNMLLSLDDGSTNQLTTPLNMIKGSYVKVVFNSVRLRTHTHVNVAAATLGGGVINHCYFQNNVVGAFDTLSHAFAFIPTSTSADNVIDHNCYWSTSGILNKYSGVNYSNLNAWTRVVTMDVGSVMCDPGFTNSSISLVDLRSFNALLRNVGVPIPGIVDDIEGTIRNATAPSLGAYEVAPLSIDFKPEAIITPFAQYCGAPASIPVEVAIRNIGIQPYTYSSAHALQVHLYVQGQPGIRTFTVNRNCPADDTIHFLSNITLSLPSGANNSDASYNITWWLTCNLDPDNLNDTATHVVESRYAPPAPTAINQSVAYNNSLTITPISGINTWPISYYTSGQGRTQRSGIYWYRSLDDTVHFHYGPSYTTPPMFANDTLYISQKRNLPLVKITEVQVSNNANAAGRTVPLPSWMNSQTALAVELTNCGDYPADLEGDSIVVITSNAAAKIWVLPRVTIQPGACLVLQFKTNTAPSDSSRTIYGIQASVAYNANFAIVYRDGRGIADAVPFNNVITATSNQAIKWSNQNVPAAVWQGAAINMGTTPVAGAYRVAWPTNASTAGPVPTATLWQVASDATPMHIGTPKPHLVLYEDNGCDGLRAPVRITVTNVPTTDISVEEPVVDTGCNLTTAQPLSVTVHNFGVQAASSINIHYSLNGSNTPVCSNTIASIPGRGSVVHTFTTPINMHLDRDTVFHVKVWVTSLATDALHTNDTCRGDFLSRYTPNTPAVTSPQTVDYAQTLTMSVNTPLNNAMAVWYDRSMNRLGTTTGTFTTPRIYYNDTFYVAAVGNQDVATTHIGTLATASSATAYPSPFNPKTRYVKEQYIFTAQDILAAGHSAGVMSSISFYLESVGGTVQSFTYSNYTVKVGTTTLSTFSNGNFASTAGFTTVFQSSAFTINRTDVGWIKIPFSTPFIWDGVSNIIIEIDRGLSTAGISTGASTRYTVQANTVISAQNTTTPRTDIASGTKGPNRPDILIGFLEPSGCESAAQQILVNVVNLPGVDANLHWDPALDTTEVASCATTSFSVDIENSGLSAINAYTLHYKIDGGAWQTVTGNANNLTTGHHRIVPLVSTHLTPGRHRIRAYITVTGDTVLSNDSIDRVFNVRFCTGTYTIGATAGNDYATLQTAIDTLHNAGVAGAITFRLDGGTYNGQYLLGPIDGTSYTKTVRFAPAVNATVPVKITYAPTQASNYVMLLDGTSNVIFDSIYFYGTYTNTQGAVYSNVLRINNSDNVTFNHSTFRTRFRSTFTNTSNLVVLGDNNNYITFNHCLMDSGYYQVTTVGGGVNTGHHLSVNNSDLLNFSYRAIDIRNIDSVQFQGDSITSQMGANNKPLAGITVSQARNAAIKKNFILLMDNFNGSKRGIQLFGCTGTNVDRVTVYNNMISLKSIATAAPNPSNMPPAGIYIDSNSTYVSVYFNSVRVQANEPSATASPASTHRAFSVDRSSNVFVLNNIFLNASKGYSYYVATDTCLRLSNYNVYWSTSDTGANRKFAFWGEAVPNFDSLRIRANRTVTGTVHEGNSMEDMPIFEGERDLRLHLAAYSGLAQYNSDVTDDIFDSIRPQIPTPTIGCHEFTRLMHNVAIAQILDPKMPRITIGNNPDVYNIETDSILVRVQFYNNGMAPEYNVHWYAMIAETNPEVRCPNRPISLPLRRMVEDSVKLFSPLGVVDTQRIIVFLELEGSTDFNPADNIDTAEFFIYPAYNLRVQSVAYTNNTPAGCRMYQVPITYTIKNEGYKDFPGNFTFDLGYDAYCHSPNNITLPNLPTVNTETVSFGDGNDLPVGTTREITLSPAYQPNLFPTGQLVDITARLRGWVTFEYDVKPANDTSAYINIPSYHTPDMPIAHDTSVDYGTYANLYATQTAVPQPRPIYWGQDSSGTYFYGPGNYIRSTHWEARQTWQYALPYFHDTTFYLCCFSTHQCTSYYAPINVTINPPLQCDVAISQVLSPRGVVGVPPDEYLEGRVYHEVDTVKLRIVNYGSQPVSNIPVGFKFMNNTMNITYLEAYDTVRVTIPGRVGDNVSYYDFKFPDSVMLQIPGNPLGGSNNSAITYSLNAWVSHPDDQQHNNDTIGTIHKFKTYHEATYDTIKNHTPTSDDGFDITRVSFNTLDNEMPEMFGYHHRFVGSYNASNADVPTLFIRHGTQDTLFVEVANNLVEHDSSTGAMLYVAIDFNRNGQYADGREGWKEVLTCNMNPDLGTVNDYCVKVRSRQTYKLPFTIPSYAHYGYMRMLVLVDADTLDGHPYPFPFNDTTRAHYYGFSNGQAQEYLLFIQEPGTEPEHDVALSRVSYPHHHHLKAMTNNFGVMIANKGQNPITSATVTAEFHNLDHAPIVRTIDWTGDLQPGTSALVSFDSVTLFHGTTTMLAYVDVPDDSLNHDNDTLRYQYHIFDTITLFFNDNFDDRPFGRWYPAEGNSRYTQNLFKRATPAKSNISGPYSTPNTYVTNPTQVVTVGTRGNRSVLYSPMFNITAIRPDTISFLLCKNMLNHSHMHMEYMNYLGEWIMCDDPDAGRDEDHVSWYDDDTTVWSGSSPAGGYETKRISISGINTELSENFQLRFVYEAPYSPNPSANYGDGVAIDNFHLGRARRPQDCGVIAFTYPETPSFGQTIYPTVVVKNFGTATAYNVPIAYHPHGVFLPIEDVCPGPIFPDSTYEFTFSTPFTILNDFPDTFSICAFTNMDQDIYNDNDTVCADFGLSPLENDMQLYSILSPLHRAVAGDSIPVRLRLRNFGQNEVESIDVHYIYNGAPTVTEHIDFVEILGHPLPSMEFYDHTFVRRVKATMGTMELLTWIDYRYDGYPYNDTIERQIVGINSVTDVSCRSVTYYQDHNTVYFFVVIDNLGARMVNDFKVGFWMDNDSTKWWRPDWYYEGCDTCKFTRFEEIFHREDGIPGGGHATHIFSATDLSRSQIREFLTAYCVVPGDQDRSNDTTTNNVLASDMLYDIRTNAVEIEENEQDSCRVRIELENIGDFPYIVNQDRYYNLTAKINGLEIKRKNVLERVDPGCTRRILFTKKIPKDPNRHYTGWGKTDINDADQPNNTSYMVRVVNYFEGTPIVHNEEFTLSQNYPNPFDGTTRIEFNLPSSGIASFCVTDALGRVVRSFKDYYHSGVNTISFQRDELPAGVYYYSIEFQGQRRMKKMILR